MSETLPAGLDASSALSAPSDDLTRALRQWYEHSGVRRDPRRLYREEQRAGRRFWAAHLTPYLTHPLVVERGADAAQQLLIKQLYQYLQFTANYELRVINRATEQIANDRTGVPLSAAERLDAFKIYTDEGYHSLYSMDVIKQVQDATQVRYDPYDFDSFLVHFDEVKRLAPANLATVVELLVAVVFETLITGSLTQVPKDLNVVSLVREIVLDHAHDEGRHHVFFSGFFSRLWGQLTVADRARLGPLLPELIVRPLSPPIEAIDVALTSIGLAPEARRQVVEESYPPEEVRASIQRTGAATLGLFERHDVWAEPRTRNAFVEAGLLEE